MHRRQCVTLLYVEHLKSFYQQILEQIAANDLSTILSCSVDDADKILTLENLKEEEVQPVFTPVIHIEDDKTYQ